MSVDPLDWLGSTAAGSSVIRHRTRCLKTVSAHGSRRCRFAHRQIATPRVGASLATISCQFRVAGDHRLHPAVRPELAEDEQRTVVGDQYPVHLPPSSAYASTGSRAAALWPR